MSIKNSPNQYNNLYGQFVIFFIFLVMGHTQYFNRRKILFKKTWDKIQAYLSPFFDLVSNYANKSLKFRPMQASYYTIYCLKFS